MRPESFAVMDVVVEIEPALTGSCSPHIDVAEYTSLVCVMKGHSRDESALLDILVCN